MADLLDQGPEDVEEVLVVWLSEVSVAAIERLNDDPLPFILIRHVDGNEDEEAGTVDHIVTVRTLCDKANGDVAARDKSDETHRRMLQLARHLDDVPLSNGRNASIDYVMVTESPRWEKYENDQILCKRARYQIGLSYVPVT